MLSLVAQKSFNMEQSGTGVPFVQDWSEFETVIHSKNTSKISSYMQNGDNVNPSIQKI